MTGPEHYKEAERLCAGAITTDNPFPHLRPDELLGAAQVHALLALAATAELIAFPPKTISLALAGAEVIDILAAELERLAASIDAVSDPAGDQWMHAESSGRREVQRKLLDRAAELRGEMQ